MQLDSLLRDKVAGLLGQDQRAWLEQFLKQADDRPSFSIILWEKVMRPSGYRSFLPNFETSSTGQSHLLGHSHMYECGFREGKHLINLPAVGYNFSDAQPVGWLDARFHRKGVDLTPMQQVETRQTMAEPLP